MTTFVTGELFVQVNYDTVLSLHSHALYTSLDFVTNKECVCVCVWAHVPAFLSTGTIHVQILLKVWVFFLLNQILGSFIDLPI